MKRISSFLFAFALLWSTVQAQTTLIKGLTVLVSFSDVNFAESEASITQMMNQPGFSGWGNNGSVRDFYLAQTAGKIDRSDTVISVTVPYPAKAYFSKTPGERTRSGLDIQDIAEQINIKYPGGFQNLTLLPDNSIQSFNVLTNAARVTDGGAWAFNTPTGSPQIKNNGTFVPINNGSITNYGFNAPDISVICHEMGHSIFGWPDLYGIFSKVGNVGHYCLMGSGGSAVSPMPIQPYLRLKKGWINTVTDITNSTTQTYSVQANSYTQVYKYSNVNNPKEYFLINAYVHGGYYLSLTGDGYTPDQGLAIWYVDEDGGYDQPTEVYPARLKLVQADGMDEMNDPATTHHDQRGDNTDLFNQNYPVFNDALYPKFRWKDGSETGLNLSEISAAGSTMTFKFNAKTSSVTVAPSPNGTVVPSGLVHVTPGQSKTFQFFPDPGYEVDQVIVNGVNQGALSSYTFSAVNSNQTLSVTYKTTTANTLPSPWASTDIGGPATAGAASYAHNVFRVKAYGNDIWGNYDQFHYAYRPLQGDGEIIAKVSLLRIADWTKVGVMFRESLQPDSKQFMAVRTGWNGIATQWRSSSGGYSDNVNNSELLLENWVKVVRSGNTFTSYYSRDGVSWTLQHSVTMPMNANIYVGLASLGASSTAQKAVFEYVTVTGGSSQAPVVSLTSPAHNASLPAGTISLTANATDADGTVSKVEFFNGSTKLGEDLTAPYSFSWTNVAAGTYNLTAKATDNSGLATTSSVVTITVTTGGDNCSSIPTYATYPTIYNTGNRVKYNNIIYEAQVSNLYNVVPGTAEHWWKTIGPCGSGNQAPSVSITAPGNGATFSAPASITIAANATDADGTISKVEFFQGGVKLGEDLTSPFSYSWANVAAGNYVLTVKATDNGGAATVSSAIAVTVSGNAAPNVSITSPANNASFNAPASVTISATATDSDGTVSKVEFFNGSTKLGEDLTAPYSFTWTNVAAGSYTLTARATDNTSAVTTSSAVAITVNGNTAPSVSITSPSNNATYTAPASVTISATATDSDGTVSKVEFFNGSTKLGEDLTAPYSFTWTNVAAGSYTLTAKATDNASAVTTSSAVSITVNGSGTCTAPAWTTAAYSKDNVVQYNGIKYIANWWTQNERPDLNNGPIGTGKPWTSLGTCNSRAGVEEALYEALTMAPNPVTSQATLTLELLSDELVQVEVLDHMGGNVLSVFEGNLAAGTYDYVVDAGALASGVYLLRVRGDQTNKLIRFVKE